jgi:hypothetical protein
MTQSKEQSLNDMVEALLASARAHQKAKTSKVNSPNPFKVNIVTQNPDGTFTTKIVDKRATDPHWTNVTRVILVRQVTCLECGRRYEAPNEQLMIRKEHKRHGVVEEALTYHDSKFNNLPIKVEYLPAYIKICHHCAYDFVPIKEAPRIKVDLEKLVPDMSFTESKVDEIIEEELEENEIGWEDPANIAALGDF